MAAIRFSMGSETISGGVHESLEFVSGAKFGDELREIVKEHLVRGPLLPIGAEVIFHSSEPVKNWSGWGPVNRPSKNQIATLFYNFGDLYGSREPLPLHVRLDLTVRERQRVFGIPMREPLEEFVERAFQLAHERMADAQYLRDYSLSERVRYATLRAEQVLKEHSIAAGVSGAVQSPYSQFAPLPCIGLLFVPSGDVSMSQQILCDNWLCRPDGELLSEKERLSALPKGMFFVEPPNSERGMLLRFDDLPMLVLPESERNCAFRRTEPSVYRSPLLYDIEDLALVPEALQLELSGPPKLFS
ncbi:MAG: hypothetical protein KDD64_02150 [Bdellovibrionales bacterium]|nr:hypothetical protein [Bdellovibrionales bacterium]